MAFAVLGMILAWFEPVVHGFLTIVEGFATLSEAETTFKRRAAQVGGSVRHRAQHILDGLDDLVDEDLAELELLAMAMPRQPTNDPNEGVLVENHRETEPRTSKNRAKTVEDHQRSPKNHAKPVVPTAFRDVFPCSKPFKAPFQMLSSPVASERVFCSFRSHCTLRKSVERMPSATCLALKSLGTRPSRMLLGRKNHHKPSCKQPKAS